MRRAAAGAGLLLAAALGAATGGCPALETSGTAVAGASNSTDPTNGGASFVGARACAACHPSVAETFAPSAHPQALTAVRDDAPQLSTGLTVPDPPAGQAWSMISYLIGGFAHTANFVDLDGFVQTTGQLGAPALWTLAGQPNGAGPAFSPFRADTSAPLPFDESCFRCHTTGAQPLNAAMPMFVDNRPGMAGAFDQAGVQCEACHGPGGAHFATRGAAVRVDRARIFLDPDGEQTCARCHSRTPDAIQAADGFILNYQQAGELRASGGHAAFTCTICHDPHASLRADRDTAIRNDCTVCHTDANMAGHAGAVLLRSDGYTEALRCESCHMPLASRNGAAGPPELVGDAARVGDVRTHIFRIYAAPGDYTAMLNDDGTAVRLDEQGRAAVTVDFVCLRCHNGNGVFELTLPRAAEIAPFVHQIPQE